jgi:hypothetical protein
MGAVTGPCVVKAGADGCQIVVKSYNGRETLIRKIEPNETCEIYLTPLKRKKVKLNV